MNKVMTYYEIQVNLHGKWQPSMDTTARKWRKDLAIHLRAYGDPARAVKIKRVKTLRILA